MPAGGGRGAHIRVRIGALADGRYPVEVSVTDAIGAVTAPFAGEIVAADLPTMPAIVTDEPRVDPTAIGEAGIALFGLLGPAGLAPAREQAGQQVGQTALLLDIAPAELRALPWELLRYPGAPRRACPFADGAAPAVRVRQGSPPPAEAGGPIHILVVVGDPDDVDLGADEEIEAIYQGVRGAPGCWQVDVVRGPDRDEFRAHYQEVAPDVLHVIGHGMDSALGPAVEVQAGGGQVWALTAEYLCEALDELPRLAVLNACRSGAGTGRAAVLARGLSDALLDAGTAAVVAMQGDLASAPAVLFTRTLYAALAACHPIDTAVAMARQEVRVSGSPDVTARDWALPVLELCADPAAVLGGWSEHPVTVLRAHPEFAEVTRMVDRAAVRRRLQRRIATRAREPRPGDGLLFVTGDAGLGKSLLVRSFLVARAARGLPVIYESLKARGHVDAADFVVGVARTAGDWLGESALQQEALAALQAAHAGTAAAGQAGSRAAHTSARADQPRTATEDAYQLLRGLLVKLAETAPLLLVLDEVGQIDERQAFVRGLLEPAAKGALPGVQVVVVGEPDALRDVTGELAESLLADRQIELAWLRREDVIALVREYVIRSEPDRVDAAQWAKLRETMLVWARSRQEENPRLRPSELQAMLMLRGMALDVATGLEQL